MCLTQVKVKIKSKKAKKDKVKESKERPKTLKPCVFYYLLVYEYLHVVLMLTYVCLCSY